VNNGTETNRCSVPFKHDSSRQHVSVKYLMFEEYEVALGWVGEYMYIQI